MTILEAIKSGLIAIWSNKIRSFLTMLGMIIGVSSVITLVSIGKGVYNDVASIVSDMGTNLVFIVSGDISGMTQSGGGNYAANPANFIKADILKKEDLVSLKAMPEVKYLSAMNILSGFIAFENKTAYPMIVGVQPDAVQTIQNLAVDKGRFFTDSDDGKSYIVLTPNQIEALFGDKNFDPVGKKVTVGKQEFEVLGTVKQKKQQTNIISSDFDNMAFIPFETVNQISGSTQIMRIFCKINDEFDAKDSAEKIKSKLLETHTKDEVSVLTQEDMLDMMSSILNIMTMMITAIASISLIVGGVGIMNIMLVSVTERTKEIGIRKAIGATDGEIMKQFLLEAIILTMLGGAIGVGLAYGAGIIFKAQTSIQAVIDAQTILLAVGISVGIGIIFGLFPAVRASKKDPVDALRYE
ncbi:MAG: ABC transporter permease [Patescibacteria group bacterium]